MKTSLTRLCATLCALLILLPPAYGQQQQECVVPQECLDQLNAPSCNLPTCIGGLTIPADDTCFLQCLINSQVEPRNEHDQWKVCIPAKANGGIYTTHPLLLPSNLELTLKAGVVIQDTDDVFQCLFGTDPSLAWNSPGPWGDHWNLDTGGGKFNKLLYAKGTPTVPISNLTIIGEADPDGNHRAKLQMRGALNEYPVLSNFVHALALWDVRNVEVKDLNIEDTGGDGILIWNGDMVNVRNCTIYNANRNGIAIISGTDITVEDCTLTGAINKSPQAGLDIEPEYGNSGNHLVRIRIKRCTAEGNGIRGFVVNLGKLTQDRPDSAPIDVLFEDCKANGDYHPSGRGFEVQGDIIDANGGGGGFPGKIEFINCSANALEGSDLLLTNFLNLQWDLRSLITLKFVGLNLNDHHGGTCSVRYWDTCVDDSDCLVHQANQTCIKQLIKLTVRGREATPLSDRIVIKGTVTGSSNDPVIEVVRVCSLDFTLPCSVSADCSVAGCTGMGEPYSCCTGAGTGDCVPSCLHSGNCGSCPAAAPYPEISGCLAIGSFQYGDADPALGLLPNLSTPQVTPVCGQNGVEDCEECDCGNNVLLCDHPNGVCDNCVIAPTTPTIYARWDNPVSEVDQPRLDTHYEIVATDPNSPNVILREGRPDWRVWSVNRNHITDIGVLFSPVAEDFKVKLMRPDGAPAARHVKGITLVPSDPAKYSNIVAGEIAGNLGSDGLVLLNSAEQAGAASVTIDGNVSGNINIPTVDSLQINGAVDAGSTITMNGIPDNAEVYLSGPLNGSINLNNQELGGLLTLAGGSAAGSQIVGGQLAGAVRLLGGAYSGSATFSSLGLSASIIMDDGGTLAPNGTIAISGDVDVDALINFSGPIDNTVGTVIVDGLMDGDICASNLNPPPVPLPDNLHLAQIGPQGSICGTPVCATAQLANEPSGVNRVRSISFSTTDNTERAVGVRLTSLHHVSPSYTGAPSPPFDAFEGQTVYLGPPDVYREWSGGNTRFVASRTQGTPHYRNWSSFRSCQILAQICEDNADCPLGGSCSTDPIDPLLHVFGSAIVPSGIYNVQLMSGKNAACAETLTISTNRWGDVEFPYSAPGGPVQPDISDVAALVDKYRSMPYAPIKARALLIGSDDFGDFSPEFFNQDLHFGQIAACVDAFRGKGYPFQMGKCENGPNACTTVSDCQGDTGPCVLYSSE